MQKEELITKINEVIVEEFEVEAVKIQPDANLMEVLELDSLDLVDLVVIIERNFGFKVKGEDFINIRTFNDFYEFVWTRLNNPEPKAG
jgi:acyl carrier protein